MGEAVDGLIKLGEAIATGSLGLLGCSVLLNIYLVVELRRVQNARVADLQAAVDKADRQTAVNAAVMEVLSALNSKLPRRG